MRLGLRVLMNGADVTPWLVEATVEQPRRTLYRSARLVFAGWSAVVPGAAWDVFASHDPVADPYAEVLLRAGTAPPDRLRRVSVARGEVPRLEVTVYDHVWTAQRRGPRETLVLVPDAGGASVVEALERYDGVVGAYRVVPRVRTVADAVRYLGRRAGFRVRVAIPAADAELAPLVLDPSSSYWQALSDLIAPWAPEVHYNRAGNELVLADSAAKAYGLGRTLALGPSSIARLDAWPSRTKRVRRVIVRFPGSR